MENKLNQAALILPLIVLEMVIGMWCPIIPWYYLLAIVTFIIFSILFLAKYEIGVYLLLPIIIILGNYIGVSVKAQNTSEKNVIPLYLPIYLSLITAFISHKVVQKKRQTNIKNPLSVPIFILLCYSLITIIFSFITYRLLSELILILNIGIYYFIIKVIDNEKLHRHLMWCWIFTSNVLSILVMISILYFLKFKFSVNIFDWLEFIINFAPHVQVRGYALGHPNYTCLLLNMSMCIIVGMLISETDIFKKRILLVSLGLCIFANFLTMSKAGIISCWIMMHFIILCSSVLRKNFFKYTLILNCVLLIFFILSILYSQQTSPRLLRSAERGGYETSIGNRLVIWGDGLKALRKKGLIPFGLGIGGYELNTRFPHAHNIYFSLFFDFGITGIICILTSLIILFNEFIIKELKGILFFQNGYFDTMSLTFIGGLIAVATHGFFEYTYMKTILWVFLAFAIVTLNLSRIERVKEIEK